MLLEEGIKEDEEIEEDEEDKVNEEDENLNSSSDNGLKLIFLYTLIVYLPNEPFVLPMLFFHLLFYDHSYNNQL